jgi:hypothetical protein
MKGIKQYLPVGAFGLSLLIHLALLLTISGIIIIDAVKPKADFLHVDGSVANTEETPPLPDFPDESTPDNPDVQSNPDATTTQAPAFSIDQISSEVTTALPSFMVAPPNGVSMGSSGIPSAESGGKGKGKGMPRPNVFSPFGSTTVSADALVGSIYDLKKNRQGGSMGNNSIALLREAFAALHKNKGDKSYLDRKYFKASTSLYASSIFVMPMEAENATRAFKCEDQIKSPGWLAYYSGWITPPETGEYRFVGFADDNMLVIVNRKTVLHAFWPEQKLGDMISTESDWEPKDADKTDGFSVIPTAPAGLRHLARYRGSWIKMEKGTAYEIKIVLAEAYGGIYSATLGIEQKGVTYPPGNGPGKQTQLPIFKLAEFTPAEIAAFKGWPSDYVTEGPNFGLSANNIEKPEQ